MTVTSGLIAPVASQVPPSPVSITATSTGAEAKAWKAMAVRYSKYVSGGPPACADCASMICAKGATSS